jgi:hypothetical protein
MNWLYVWILTIVNPIKGTIITHAWPGSMPDLTAYQNGTELLIEQTDDDPSEYPEGPKEAWAKAQNAASHLIAKIERQPVEDREPANGLPEDVPTPEQEAQRDAENHADMLQFLRESTPPTENAAELHTIERQTWYAPVYYDQGACFHRIGWTHIQGDPDDCVAVMEKQAPGEFEFVSRITVELSAAVRNLDLEPPASASA